MDRNTAKQLIKNTFNFPFDESKFRNFTINLLNDVDENKAFGYISGNYIKNSFKDHVTKYRRLGTYTDPDGDKIDVLIVHLKKDWALERSRTMLRNFVADYLKNRDEKDAALVGYTTSDPDGWRFSYVRMQYKLEQTESGKIKVKEELTPAKRYSFLVGKNEPNHTAQAQLVDILENDKKNPSLNDIEAAFSVDAVTKQFYKDYRFHFEKIWHELDDIASKDPKIAAEFEAKSIDTANFAKKLMGQIVFLYFLQKKGWLGVGKDNSGNFKEWGTGPKNFLHRLFNKEFTDYGNFFNDILEPLFYEALATEHNDDYFSKLDCKIPFLNGGLFEPLNEYNWVETDICIDNDLIADVFKTFDQYNFTVREDEPLEKEVAVDPEMLGKVFENLLPENLRKGKGAYYTPRTIVHYMCQESLINYLDTTINSPLASRDVDQRSRKRGETSDDVSGCVVPKEDIETLIHEGDIILELETAIEYGTKSYKSVLMDSIKDNAKVLDLALANIKVCDPAIGSGAFPVGMLTEIVKARTVLTLYLDNSPLERGVPKGRGVYNLKRHCIQNSLYGVDIDPGAIDIAKLRFWLSLVVDADVPEALPNLDYKIMQGNSLIESFGGININQVHIEYSDLINTIEDFEKKIVEFNEEKKMIQKTFFDELSKTNNQNQELLNQVNGLDRAIKKNKTEIAKLATKLDTNKTKMEEDTQIEHLHELQSELYNCKDKYHKVDLRDEIENTIVKIFHSKIEQEKDDYFKAETKMIETANRFPTNEQRKQYIEKETQELKKTFNFDYLALEQQLHEFTKKDKIRPFFPWHLYFADVFKDNNGFDIVIANPPYVFARDSKSKGFTDSDKQYFIQHYKVAEYQLNLYHLFIEKGYLLSKSNGSICLITPNNWLTINTNKKLRHFILDNSDIKIVNFYAKVFESADVDSSIVLFTKSNDNKDIELLEYTDDFHSVYKTKTNFFMKQKDYIINIELFKNTEIIKILEKIELQSVQLKTIADVKSGLKAYEIGKGNPPQTVEMKQNRIYHSVSKIDEKYIQYLDGKDVCRYQIGWSSEYLKYGNNLAARRKDFSLFSTPRILIRQIPSPLPYCVNACFTKELLLNDLNSMNVINISIAPQLVLGVLNSKLISFWFAHKFGKLQRGIFPQFKVNELAIFPIPKQHKKISKITVVLVEKILQKKKQKEKTQQLENQIDLIVYKLYDLSYEEVKIVDENVDKVLSSFGLSKADYERMSLEEFGKLKC